MAEKLPPGTLCAVCEDIATGKHYSVASCNGCKTFFRRALVNKREFVCQGNGNCPVNKGVRCACRYCRLQKCLSVGMDKSFIQNDRDRIGYTKRKRRNDDINKGEEYDSNHDRYSGSPRNGSSSPGGNSDFKDFKMDMNTLDPIAEKLTTLENNFTLLLSRCNDLKLYETLEEALNAPSRFLKPINCDWNDPVVMAKRADQKMPFWRQRLIALYIDWAKTFSTFRSLPYTDKVAMVTNHASSFMIMCEAFRTPEFVKLDVVRSSGEFCGIINNSETGSSRVPSEVSSSISGEVEENDLSTSRLESSINDGIIFGEGNDLFENNHKFELKKVKMEPLDVDPKLEMIRLPTEYGSLPENYATWIPKDYGHPTAGHEGKSEKHNFFDPRVFSDRRPSSTNRHDRSIVNTLASKSNMAQTSLSGITPVLAVMIDLVMKPFRQLNFSTTEFSLLQAIMFFDPDTEDLDSASQRNVIAEQKKLLKVLHRHLQKAYNPIEANDRYSSILLRIPTIRRAAAKKNESLQVLDMLQVHEINPLVKETSLGPRPSNTNHILGISGPNNLDSYLKSN